MLFKKREKNTKESKTIDYELVKQLYFKYKDYNLYRSEVLTKEENSLLCECLSNLKDYSFVFKCIDEYDNKVIENHFINDIGYINWLESYLNKVFRFGFSSGINKYFDANDEICNPDPNDWTNIYLTSYFLELILDYCNKKSPESIINYNNNGWIIKVKFDNKCYKFYYTFGPNRVMVNKTGNLENAIEYSDVIAYAKEKNKGFVLKKGGNL